MSKVKDPQTDAELFHGRRAKQRENFEKSGLDGFHESHVLEFALGFCVPRIDTHPTAHRLLKTFGTLANVVNTHPKQLESVEGMGKQSAAFLNFLKHFVTFYMKSAHKLNKIQTSQDAIDHLREVMRTYSTEEFVMIILGLDGEILWQEQVRGTINKVNLEFRDIVETVVRFKSARAIIIAHNHPETSANPSESDTLFTRALVNTLMPLGIEMRDHLIFSKTGEVFSFRNSRLVEMFVNEHQKYSRSRDWKMYSWDDLTD